jgi:DNA polymerase III epsilon subunit-like protein
MSYNLDDVLIFDAETTGLPAKGADWKEHFQMFPNVVSLAWIFRGVEKDYIVKPNGWTIPQETVDIHGITTEFALENGIPFEVIAAEFAEDALQASFVSAHNIYFDSSMVKSNILKWCGQSFFDEYQVEAGLHKGKRIDTMMKTIKFVQAKYADGRVGKWPKLEELYDKLFPGETFEAHKSLADCQALKRCLPPLIDLGIIMLALKQYPGDATTTKEAKSTKSPENKIEFAQPAVMMPKEITEAIKPEKREVGNYADKTKEEIQATPTGLSATSTTNQGFNPLLDIDDF